MGYPGARLFSSFSHGEKVAAKQPDEGGTEFQKNSTVLPP
jgi:hypothetical protein